MKYFIRTLLILICFSCNRERQKQSITWLYGDGGVEMLNGNVKKLIYESFGNTRPIPLHWEYTLDERGNIVTAVNIGPGGIDTFKYNTVYKNGRKIESIGIKNSGLRVVYKYDNYEHITSFGFTMDTGDASKARDTFDVKYRFRYDKNGCLTELKENSWINKYKYLHDKKGAISGEEHTCSDELGRFTYSTKDTTRYVLIDSKNNWLKAIRFGDTITRKITYY